MNEERKGGGEEVQEPGVPGAPRGSREIRVFRYSWSLSGRPNLEVFLPELLEDEIDEVEQLFQLILGIQRRMHMRLPTADEVYGILSKQGTDATPTPDAADGGR